MPPIALALLATFLIAAPPAAGQLPAGEAGARGELLYATHCIGCHTTQVHWRQGKLARDWASLVREVRRWAANGALSWTDEEVVDVARYLNATQYHFATPAGTQIGGRGADSPVARSN